MIIFQLNPEMDVEILDFSKKNCVKRGYETSTHSTFSQIHNVGNNGINANILFRYISSFFIIWILRF